MSLTLKLNRLWAALGWLMLVAVVVLSLVPIQAQVPVAGLDKLNHVLAYASLMYWWGMVQTNRRWSWALVLVFMGAGLEFAQSLTGYRFMEWRDLVANLAGVGAGLALLATPAGRLLSWLDRQLGDRFNTGSA